MNVYLLDIERLVQQALKEKLEAFTGVDFSVSKKSFPQPKTLKAEEVIIFGSYHSGNHAAIELWLELNPARKFLILSDRMTVNELAALRKVSALVIRLGIQGELNDNQWLLMVIASIKSDS